MAKKVIRLNESEMESLIKKTVERALNENSSPNVEQLDPLAKDSVNEGKKSKTLLTEASTTEALIAAGPFLAMLGVGTGRFISEFNKFRKENPEASTQECLKAAWVSIGKEISAFRR